MDVRPSSERIGKRGRRHRAVTETLRERLKEGTWGAGTKLPTLRELGDEFQVSTSTIRHALRLLEHEGRLYHVPSVGTFVRPVSPMQPATDQLAVALVLVDIAGPIGSGIVTGAEQACQSRGWRLQVADDRDRPELEHDNLSRLATSGSRGAVVMPMCHEDTIELLFGLKLQGYPFVLVDHAVKGLKVDLVESDHEKGGYLATDHLLRAGHKRVLMLTGMPTWSSIERRVQGYERALRDHGVRPGSDWIIWYDAGMRDSDPDKRSPWIPASEAITPALQKAELPIAVFAFNAYAGWGVLEACRQLNLRVPEDVSLVCFDETEITRIMYPPMTTIAQQSVELGRKAVDLLERRFRDPKAEPEHILLDVKLITRKSVCSPNPRT